MPVLKSKIGTTTFRRRTLVQGERGSFFQNREYHFGMDTDLRCEVPEDVWEDLKEQYFDRSTNLKYKEAFLTI